tara:strand:- start:407 stop:679 length:273 start_codon:yes stop_codon:yes gene_type:complete
MKHIVIAGPFIWYIIHYIIGQWAYPTFCAPRGFIGFIESLLLTNAPHCEALRYTLTLSSYNIKYMWIVWGATLLSFLKDKHYAKLPQKDN